MKSSSLRIQCSRSGALRRTVRLPLLKWCDAASVVPEESLFFLPLMCKILWLCFSVPKALQERELQDGSRFSLLRFKSATTQKKVRYQVCSSTICKTCSDFQVIVLLFVYFTTLHGAVSPVVLKEKNLSDF